MRSPKNPQIDSTSTRYGKVYWKTCVIDSLCADAPPPNKRGPVGAFGSRAGDVGGVAPATYTIKIGNHKFHQETEQADADVLFPGSSVSTSCLRTCIHLPRLKERPPPAQRVGFKWAQKPRKKASKSLRLSFESLS